MSQDRPKQPESTKQTPQTPQSNQGWQKLAQTLQQAWRRSQPVLKTQSAKALRGTIGLLQGVAGKLEAQPNRQTIQPSADTLPSAATLPPETPDQPNTIGVAAEGTPTQPTLKEVASKFQSAPRATQLSLWERVRIYLPRFLVWWEMALAKIRTRLPAPVNQKLPNNTALTGAIAAVVILLLWSISALLPGNPPQAAQVPSQVKAPSGIKAPPQLKAPKAPQPVETLSPPTPVLTPEQRLIASIQNRVNEITSQYANGLIQSIQVNFQSSRLTVGVNDDWYGFGAAQQDKLATDMWRRAQELDFKDLEILDSQGALVARTPVVGSNMVILKRQIPSTS